MIVNTKWRNAQPRPTAAGPELQHTVERVSVPGRAALLLAACLALGGCSVLDKPVRAAVYDFAVKPCFPPKEKAR